jgi:hypothetical protein
MDGPHDTYFADTLSRALEISEVCEPARTGRLPFAITTASPPRLLSRLPMRQPGATHRKSRNEKGGQSTAPEDYPATEATCGIAKKFTIQVYCQGSPKTTESVGPLALSPSDVADFGPDHERPNAGDGNEGETAETQCHLDSWRE